MGLPVSIVWNLGLKGFYRRFHPFGFGCQYRFYKLRKAPCFRWRDTRTRRVLWSTESDTLYYKVSAPFFSLLPYQFYELRFIREKNGDALTINQRLTQTKALGICPAYV
jgi:hypothetical protein